MSLLNQCYKIADLIYSVSRHYKTLFNHQVTKEASEYVLHDLAKFCGAYELDISQNKEDILPLDMAKKIGRLEVYQHITRTLRMTERDKELIAQKFFNIENAQNQDKGII